MARPQFRTREGLTDHATFSKELEDRWRFAQHYENTLTKGLKARYGVLAVVVSARLSIINEVIGSNV